MMIEIEIWTRSDPTFYKSVADPSRFDTNPTRGSVQLDYGSGINGYGITDPEFIFSVAFKIPTKIMFPFFLRFFAYLPTVGTLQCT
jgi:hypothetical protein